MVKPTLKPEPDKKAEDLKADDKLKEWGILPAAVVIDESEKEKDKKDAEAAITEFDNLETDVDDSPRPCVVKFCACFAVFIILLIVSCTIGSFLYFHYGRSGGHKFKGWCSVNYDGDENDSGEKRQHGGQHGDKSSSEERPNWLYPRPTGPPGGQRTCGQNTEVNVDDQFSRVERPEESDCERITILHDYNTNISAYRLWKSEICYVTWIEDEVLMNPEEFWNNMQDPYYLNQHFNELSLFYRAVLPAIPTPLHEQENGKYGEYLDGPKEFLCQGAESYWIEKIPDEEIEEFMQMIDQVIQELLQLAAAADDQQEQQQDQDWSPDHPGDGGYGGEETDLPWNGQPWDWPMGGDGDGWPMDDGIGDRPKPYHGDGTHGGYRGDDDGGHHGGFHDRRRRGAGKKHSNRPFSGKRRNKNNKALQAIKAAAVKAAKCAQLTADNMRQIGNQGKVVGVKVAPPCLLQKAQEMGLIPSTR